MATSATGLNVLTDSASTAPEQYEARIHLNGDLTTVKCDSKTLTKLTSDADREQVITVTFAGNTENTDTHSYRVKKLPETSEDLGWRLQNTDPFVAPWHSFSQFFQQVINTFKFSEDKDVLSLSNKLNGENAPAFFRAVREGNKQLVINMLSAGFNLNTPSIVKHQYCGLMSDREPSWKGGPYPPHKYLRRSALHFAALHKKFEIIELLIEHGANIDLPDKNGLTPFLLTIEENKLEAASALIKLNCDVMAENCNGDNLLQIAVKQKNIDTVKFCIEKVEWPENSIGPALHDAFYLAAKKPDSTMISMYILQLDESHPFLVHSLTYALDYKNLKLAREIVTFLQENGHIDIVEKACSDKSLLQSPNTESLAFFKQELLEVIRANTMKESPKSDTSDEKS
ncbi:MAG: ankyrin repeat domain-containing protein [Shewanella sp.]|nr:ankyrin repeat domain-containing protein [Shewanella sp.]